MAVLHLPDKRPREVPRQKVLKKWSCSSSAIYNDHVEKQVTSSTSSDLIGAMGFAIHGAAALCAQVAQPVLNITLKLYKLASSFATRVRNSTMIPTLRL
eukprot:7250075-Heterocapsa_arctica.AAC.1